MTTGHLVCACDGNSSPASSIGEKIITSRQSGSLVCQAIFTHFFPPGD